MSKQSKNITLIALALVSVISLSACNEKNRIGSLDDECRNNRDNCERIGSSSNGFNSGGSSFFPWFMGNSSSGISSGSSSAGLGNRSGTVTAPSTALSSPSASVSRGVMGSTGSSIGAAS